ncbi:MAG: D-glycero-beta-D-manno-heptose-7-phosphate kinase [Bdellovibrionales bacterium]|nr:D-glycero-beta-D-manno-heptose-7-phosphate kinase [Bdellovibrionales bacterium]
MIKVQSKEITEAKSFLRENLQNLEGRKILVVGDVGLDEYLDGEVRRISPEAPVPVVEVLKREFRVGLAANVAQNVHSLGGVGLLVGLVGADEAARDLSQLLKSNGVSEQNLIADSSRPTTRKVRVMSGQHHVVRVDFEEKKYLTPAAEKQLSGKVASLIEQADGLILQDYGKGVLSESLTQDLISLAHKHGKKVVVDPHRTTPLRYYRGADLIKPNKEEAFILSGLNLDDLHIHENSLLEVGKAIQNQTQCKNLIITQGMSGVSLFQGEQVTQIPTEPKQVFDVTGAGDTYLAAFCLAWFAGFEPIVSAVMANAAAGVVVGKIGSVPCAKHELLAALG